MINPPSSLRAGFAAVLAAAASLAFANPAAAQSADNAVPLPHLSPGLPPNVPGEGGPGPSDPAAGNVNAAKAAAPPASPFGGDLTGDDFDTTVPDGGGIEVTPNLGPPKDIRAGTYTLEARMTADGPALGPGVTWRIFGATPGPDGSLPLVGQSTGGVVYLKLDPGTYYVHAAFGFAGSIQKISVTGPTGGQVVVLDAGGLRLLALNGDQPLNNDVVFDVYAADESGAAGQMPLVTTQPGKVVGLTAGFYHIVSRYGSANAQATADVQVDAGKLTQATLFQKAARLTLKLVQTHGGEALADTVWSVTSAAGQTVLASSVGAFPSVVLAAGDYTAIARHAGTTYTQAFTVQPGADRDVEVLLSGPAPTSG